MLNHSQPSLDTKDLQRILQRTGNKKAEDIFQPFVTAFSSFISVRSHLLLTQCHKQSFSKSQKSTIIFPLN